MKKSLLLIVRLLAILVLAIAVFQTQSRQENGKAASNTLYVAPGTSCDSLPNCYSSIQGAVGAATDGDTIKIAAGTYSDVNSLDNGSQVVYLSKSLTLLGGFTTSDWENADPIANRVIIDPLHLGRGVTVAGSAGASQVSLNGLTIQNGNGMGNGGGIAISASTVTLTNLVIQDNEGSRTAAGSGGGIYALNSSLTLTNSQILGNSNYGDTTHTNNSMGGGIYMENKTAEYHQLILQNNTLQSNTAAAVSGSKGDGGGAYIISNYTEIDYEWVYYLYGEITDNQILDNSANGYTGLGGGLYLTADLNVTGNTITGNTAREAGGGIYMYEGGKEFKNNLINNNVTTAATCNWYDCGGGGLYIYSNSSLLKVMFNNFIGNTTASHAGGVNISDMDGSFIANTLRGNHADLDGGGLVMNHSHPSTRFLSNVVSANSVNSGGKGAGIYVSSGGNHYMAMDNTTIANNTGGAGIYDDNGQIHFNNTIVYGHSVGAQFETSGGDSVGSLVMNHTLWENNVANTHSDSQPGAISDLLPVSGQAHFTNAPGSDFHLESNSDAINAGGDILLIYSGGYPFLHYDVDNYLDRDADPRQMGSAPDVGAYEWTTYHGDITLSQSYTRQATITPGGRGVVHLALGVDSAAKTAGGGYIVVKLTPSSALQNATVSNSDCQVYKEFAGVDPGFFQVFCTPALLSPGSSWQADVNLFAKTDYLGTVTSEAALFPLGLLDDNPANNTPTPLTFQVEPGPPLGDLWVSLGATPYAKPGGRITYTLTWQNSGTAAVGSVVVTDTLAATTAFVSATNGGIHSGKTVTWNVGTLAPGASGSATVVATASSSLVDDDIVSNAAQIASSDPQEGSPDNQATAKTRITTKSGDILIEDYGSGSSATVQRTYDAKGAPIDEWKVSLDYLTVFGYQQEPAGPDLPSYKITNTLPTLWSFVSGRFSPAMTANYSSGKLTYTSLNPLHPGAVGWIAKNIFAINPQAGASILDTVRVDYTTATGDDLFKTTSTSNVVPIFPPLITFPNDGYMCFDPLGKMEIKGGAQPGVTIKVFENGVYIASGTADSTGKFDFRYAGSGLSYDVPIYITAVACFDSNCSASSRSVRVLESNQFWCPQRSFMRKVIPPSGGFPEKEWNFEFKDSTGQYNSNNFQIPGFLGFHGTEIHMYACCTAPHQNYMIIADNKEYHPDHTEKAEDGATIYVFKIDSAHEVRYKIECDGLAEGGGNVLIDPDGYVFDSAQGLTALIPNAKVTAMAWLPEWGGWVEWPAALYNDQVNPQITGADGYFAFFTPPGLYYIKVEDTLNRFQPWTSPVVQVVNEIVHVNAPVTLLAPSSSYIVKVTPQGISPTTLNIPLGSTVTWESDLTNPSASELTRYTSNPILRLLSKLDVMVNVLGWDSGRLAPGQTYSRVFTQKGTYTYTDGMNHTSTIIVGNSYSVFLPFVKK
jgi:uncharacterized repeat protein (TIGR01451 family)